MAKLLEINRQEATDLLVTISSGLDSIKDFSDDNPLKNRLITIRQKINLLYPEA